MFLISTRSRFGMVEFLVKSDVFDDRFVFQERALHCAHEMHAVHQYFSPQICVLCSKMCICFHYSLIFFQDLCIFSQICVFLPFPHALHRYFSPQICIFFSKMCRFFHQRFPRCVHFSIPSVSRSFGVTCAEMGVWLSYGQMATFAHEFPEDVFMPSYIIFRQKSVKQRPTVLDGGSCGQQYGWTTLSLVEAELKIRSD